MVLCKHFQQGNCRFGSKCNFEHIDIKQLVKNDIESAINGKQYPLSCYGPFKDKPCIPNFIEDQSFEEVRLMCYEARQKNCFDQFYQQFSMWVNEAMNKMKALLQPSYEIMNILTIIYDAPVTTSNSTNSNNSGSGTSNPFGANVPSDGGASSIFGKSTTSSAVGNVFGGGSIFGGNTNANNAMQQAGSIFGGQNSFAAQQQSSIFGQQSQQQGNTGSIFGTAGKPTMFNQQQMISSGGSSNFGLFAQTAQQTAPMFNQQTNFGQQQLQQQQQQMLQPQQSYYGVQPMQQNINSFGSAQPQQAQNLFGQTTQMQQPNPMGTNMFAQAMQQNNVGAPPAGFFQQTGSTISLQNAPQQMPVQQQQQQQQLMSQQPQDLTRNQISQSNAQSNAANSVYSKLEDLAPAEIEAFKADFFEPGKLPFSPPPLELLN